MSDLIETRLMKHTRLRILELDGFEAGTERAWNFVDDPDHAWIRDSWTGRAIDPRLPMTGVQQ